MVWNDDGHKDRQQSNEVELSVNRQLKFPKGGGDLACSKTVGIDDLIMDDQCIAGRADMVKEIIARIEDFGRGGKFLKKRSSRLI